MPSDVCSRCGQPIDAGDPTRICATCAGEASAGAKSAGTPGSGRQGTTVEPPVRHTDTPHGAEPMETFQTEPAGTSGSDVNPELKVRR